MHQNLLSKDESRAWMAMHSGDYRMCRKGPTLAVGCLRDDIHLTPLALELGFSVEMRRNATWVFRLGDWHIWRANYRVPKGSGYWRIGGEREGVLKNQRWSEGGLEWALRWVNEQLMKENGNVTE